MSPMTWIVTLEGAEPAWVDCPCINVSVHIIDLFGELPKIDWGCLEPNDSIRSTALHHKRGIVEIEKLMPSSSWAGCWRGCRLESSQVVRLCYWMSCARRNCLPRHSVDKDPIRPRDSRLVRLAMTAPSLPSTHDNQLMQSSSETRDR
jgi:hypothetical protein